MVAGLNDGAVYRSCLYIIYTSVNPTKLDIQSTLVISTSVISNNRLSRRENLVIL